MTTNHNNLLYSVVLELTSTNAAAMATTMGHQAHALFLDLIQQVDPALSARLHDESGYRPFTVSPLSGGKVQGDSVLLRPGMACRLRVTLLDGGALWQTLSHQFLQSGPVCLRLGAAEFRLDRMLSTNAADPTGWAAVTDWQTLANEAVPAHFSSLRLRFASPTAFSMGNKNFTLFPEPSLMWDSFLRVWEGYAPAVLQIDKDALREYVKKEVFVSDYELQTTTLRFPNYPQKGFLGVCTYRVKSSPPELHQLVALARFARYAGVGYKTTMGMGQVRLE